jgi:predicted permease
MSRKRAFMLPWNRRRIDAEVAVEFQFHLQERIEQFVAAGMSRQDAEAEATRRFGNLESYRQVVQRIDEETMRNQSFSDAINAAGREVRLAGRALLRTPVFFFITVLTLALGVGATTAIFTLLDAVVLQPLPYPNADRLVWLTSPVPKMKGQTEWGLARHEMYYFLDHGRTLDAMGVYSSSTVKVQGTTGSPPERANWVRTSASLFNVLGFKPRLGRLIITDDNRDRAPSVVVLSHAYWMRRFGGDTTIVGRTILIEDTPMRVVGVLQKGQELPSATTDVWAPAYVDTTVKVNNHTWSAIGRLRNNVTPEEAQHELAPLTARMVSDLPNVYSNGWIEHTGFTTKVVSLREAVVGTMLTRALWALFAAVALVLLIAMGNVANLFLARLDARQREVAVRSALGAERSHLAMLYLSESLLIASIAAVAAVAISWALLKLLVMLAPSQLPRLAEVHLNVLSVVFALGASLLAGLVFGIAPLFAQNLKLSVLRDGGRGMHSSRRGVMARRTLVATQMAFAVVLLASSMLMVKTFRNLLSVKPGFDPTGVVTMAISLPDERYGRGGPKYFESSAAATSFFEQLANRVSAMPGVKTVGYGDRLPLMSGDWCTGITIEGPTPESAHGACPADAIVSPGYFEAMGIKVTGRSLSWGGMHAYDGGVIVSKAFADHYWPNENPIGKGLRYYGTKPPFYRVVGIAEDVRHNGVDAPIVEMAYFPMLPIPDAALWSPPSETNLVVRGQIADPAEFAREVTRAATAIEPQAMVTNAQSMETVVAHSVAKQSFTMALLVISAGIAMLLAAVGLYGVISYLVEQRRGEIGIRMALGAEAGKVTGMVLGQSLRLALSGILVGVAAAFVATRFLRALLFGVEPNDAMTLVTVPLALIAVVIVAAFAPAMRASRINPIEALRGD